MKKIVWSRRAIKEFDDTYFFWEINNNSDVYSQKLLDETLIKINQIAENPLIGEEVGANFRRVLVLQKFSIIYKVHKEKINISAFFDNRRNPENNFN